MRIDSNIINLIGKRFLNIETKFNLCIDVNELSSSVIPLLVEDLLTFTEKDPASDGCP